jgi:tetratricopeptide (TPR) repeat protein
MAGLLTVLGLSVGLGVALWQAHLARASAAQSQATLAFLQNTLYTAEPVYGAPDATIRQALDSAAAHVDRELADQPLVAASVHSTVAYTYYGLGLYDLAERHQRRAVDLYGGAGRSSRLDLGNELSNLALTLDAQGRYEEAAPLFERALPIVRALGTSGQRASVSNAYASTLDALGRTDAAEQLYREAISIWRSEHNPTLPLALNNLAVLYEGSRRTAEAVPVVEEAAAELRRGGGAERARLGPVLTTLGTLYDYVDRADAARDTLDEALRVLDETLGASHPKTMLALASRALVDARAEQFATAQPRARDAYNRALGALPSDDPIRLHTETILAQSLCGLSPDSAQVGLPLARKAFEARAAVYGGEHYLTATSESIYGACLVSSGRVTRSRTHLAHAYRMLKAARGEEDARTRDARIRLGGVERR